MFLLTFPYCLKHLCFNLEELLLAIVMCHPGIMLHVHGESEFSCLNSWCELLLFLFVFLYWQ